VNEQNNAALMQAIVGVIVVDFFQLFARVSTSDAFIRSGKCALSAPTPLPSDCLMDSKDQCIDAVAVTPANGQKFGSTIGATFDDVGFCGTINEGPGVWYSITGDGTVYTVDTCSFADFDTRITILKGSCNTLMCVDGNDQSVDQDCGEGTSRVAFQSVSGVTYYVLVHGIDASVGA
jgi:hypothetical protein